ncbi:hypothetical protein G6Z17_01545 [Clostridium perfringens]|nr:hypothetical protein [Clostridium perfringens]
MMGRKCFDEKRIILEDLNFQLEVKKIKKVKNLWNEGTSFKEIVKEVGREEDEVFLLLLHLARKGRIENRVGYIWGMQR